MTPDLMGTYSSTIAMVVVLLLIAWLFRRKPDARSRRAGPIDPIQASSYYRAYLGEVLRLAGFDPVQILRGKENIGSGELLELICKAEELLLLRIVKTLHNGRPEPEYTLKEFNEYRAGQSHAKAKAMGVQDHVMEMAMTLLKKINPILQQVAGDWVQGK